MADGDGTVSPRRVPGRRVKTGAYLSGTGVERAGLWTVVRMGQYYRLDPAATDSGYADRNIGDANAIRGSGLLARNVEPDAAGWRGFA